MYVHGHMHVKSVSAASFSHVLSVYAMATTHAHGHAMTCTHTEPCAHMHEVAHVCTHMNTAWSFHLLLAAGTQEMCRI